MGNTRKSLALEIYGRVQGVGFRMNVKRIAKKLELTGFVRNKEDGGVEIVAQGNKAELEQFLALVQKNPGLSSITGMSYHWREIDKEYTDFEIKKESNFVIDQIKAFYNLGKNVVLGDKVDKSLHIAIIPDGNRRWAREKGLDESFGHYKSGDFENILSLIHESKALGVKYLSFWGFSTDNWKRSEKEINAIFSLLLRMSEKLVDVAQKENIRFRHIGRKDRLPLDLVNALANLEEKTKNNTELNVQLCLDYGGRDEIVRAVNKLLKEKLNEIKEEDICKMLDSAGIPDPDLIIRTSGEKRLSGFMPFQGAYAELYFSEVYFPDFGPEELRKAVLEFNQRKRRFGGT